MQQQQKIVVDQLLKTYRVQSRTSPPKFALSPCKDPLGAYAKAEAVGSMCETHSPRKLWKARSRLYQRRFLRPNTKFAAFLMIFRDPQDIQTFAPLQFQKLQICCTFPSKIMIFSEFLQNFAEISLRSAFFAENFTKILQNDFRNM